MSDVKGREQNRNKAGTAPGRPKRPSAGTAQGRPKRPSAGAAPGRPKRQSAGAASGGPKRPSPGAASGRPKRPSPVAASGRTDNPPAGVKSAASRGMERSAAYTRQRRTEGTGRSVNSYTGNGRGRAGYAGTGRNGRYARSRRRRNPGTALYLFAGIICAFVVIGIIITSVYGKSHFFKGTIINGIDASGLTVEELESRMRLYSLKVNQRTADGSYISEVITGDAIGVRVSNTDGLDEVLKRQSFINGISGFIGKKERTYEISGLYGYVPEALDQAVSKLKGFSRDFVKDPVDAGLSDYDPMQGFIVTPAEEGNRLNEARTRSVIKDAVDSLLTEVDLDAMGCYDRPSVYEDDPILTKLAANSQKYAKISITYDFGDSKEVVDGNVICDWLDMDLKTGEVSLDQSRVDEYVTGLKKKYDTIFGKRTFHTSYGSDVTISGGDYGWWMDVPAEQAALKDMLQKGESGTREPVYHQRAASHGEKDWGDSYVEVNLTAQHVFMYKDGVRVFDTDCVSGNERRGFNTPEGTYSITYKERNAMLVGENYETPVSYWMPFNNNIGLHDAVWRDSFGGDIYKTSGSHGCVNLPYSAAKQIYGYVEKGMPVFCYHLSGTESGNTTGQSAGQQAQAVIDAISAIGAVDKDSAKKIARARQLYQEASEEARACVSNIGVLEQAESELAGMQ